jgi:hypothetical protein
MTAAQDVTAASDACLLKAWIVSDIHPEFPAIVASTSLRKQLQLPQQRNASAQGGPSVTIELCGAMSRCEPSGEPDLVSTAKPRPEP